MEDNLKTALNHSRWTLAEVDEIIFMLDIIVVLMATNDILRWIFIIKAALDFITTMYKSTKVNRKDF